MPNVIILNGFRRATLIWAESIRRTQRDCFVPGRIIREHMALQAGTRLGPYEILSLIGAGGMGEVYQARDTRLDRKVAVKVLAPELASDPEFRARFEREAKAISALNHPHICGLYDIGREHDTEYLVLELLEGETLAARLERGPLPLARCSASGSRSRTRSRPHTGTASSIGI